MGLVDCCSCVSPLRKVPGAQIFHVGLITKFKLMCFANLAAASEVDLCSVNNPIDFFIVQAGFSVSIRDPHARKFLLLIKCP